MECTTNFVQGFPNFVCDRKAYVLVEPSFTEDAAVQQNVLQLQVIGCIQVLRSSNKFFREFLIFNMLKSIMRGSRRVHNSFVILRFLSPAQVHTTCDVTENKDNSTGQGRHLQGVLSIGTTLTVNWNII